MNPSGVKGKFVVATTARSVCDDNARVFEKAGSLRFLALGTRRGVRGIPPERTRLLPAFGLANYIAMETLSPFRAEAFRFRMHPWFDHWVKKQMIPGDHILSSYGYANASFKFARQNGGKTFLDGGNSHPENFWTVLSEEHRRWNSPHPPVARHHYERSKAMMDDVDFVISPSSFVTKSFLERGFKPEQILKIVYPIDLSLFRPATFQRPQSRPITIINTGSLSLRKGTPYLLEAFKLVRKIHPHARLLLTRVIQDDVKFILARHADLPIEWAPTLSHAQLSTRLQSADIFVLPSLEDGFARTVTEALACGLPVITTPNTGASDLIQSDINGEIVPIRDARALAGAILKWVERTMTPGYQPRVVINHELLNFDSFAMMFTGQLHQLGLL